MNAPRQHHLRSPQPRTVPAASLLLLVWLASCTQAVPSTYERPYGESPFLPSEARLEGADFLAPDALTRSAECGKCHAEIARQWEDSLHRASAVDPNARFAIDRSAEDYGVAATRLCEGCHDPGRLLSGGIDRRAPPNPAAQREGVSCLACHLVTATHETTQTGAVANGSYTISPLPRELLFPTDKASERLHAEALRRPFLSENRFCDACHRFFVPTQMAGSPPGRLRLQSEEGMGTRFGDPTAPGYKSCVDCHMPRIPGKDPAARDGLIHDHRSLGSNMMVPALLGNTAQVEATLAFRRAGAVAILVQDLERDALGGLVLPVVLRNELNGHDFPSGATDISEAWIEVTLRDATGQVVFRSPGLGEDRYLSPDAPSLNSVATLSGGDLDANHDLFSQIELRRHPRVRVGKTQTLRAPLDLPGSTALPLRATVVLRSRHGNERWNNWTFNWQDVEVPVADLAEAERTFSTLPPPLPALPPPPQLPPAPDGMSLIPGGRFPIGADPRVESAAVDDEFPPHHVTLAPFYIDRVPVTNEDYAAAVRRGVVPAPPAFDTPPRDRHSWRGDEPPAGLESHPVVLVTFEEAARYCESFGKRMPTEFEWEAAARGKEGRRYAWGDEYAPETCNTSASGLHETHPAGARPDNASPFGVLDLGCNVLEWTSSIYDAYPRTRHIDNRDGWWVEFNRDVYVVRGANFELLPWRSRASHRGTEDPAGRKIIGFRCVADVPEGTP